MSDAEYLALNEPLVGGDDDADPGSSWAGEGPATSAPQYAAAPTYDDSEPPTLKLNYNDGDVYWIDPEEAAKARTLRDSDHVYESLDYDRCENKLFRDRFFGASKQQIDKVKAFTRSYNFWRWVFIFLIGATTAIVAFFIDYIVKHLQSSKFKTLDGMVRDCSDNSVSAGNNVGCLFGPWAALAVINSSMVLLASILTVFFAPTAAGSGIPEIKCTLNGVKRRDWLTFKTMCVKVIGVLFSVSATMPVGKEGPMIHSGAIIGAGLPQGKSTRIGIEVNKTTFRNDRAKRDFISAGSAAGVSAAFGAQIGGVLFSLEEGASFWNQSLTWRTLFCTMSSLFVLHLFQGPTVRSHEGGHSFGNGLLTSGGLLSFGNFEDYKRECILTSCGGANSNSTECPFNLSCEKPLWRVQDLIAFILMAIGGGLLGALWNHAQISITKLRMKFVTTSFRKLSEAVFFAFLNTSIMYTIAMYFGECESKSSVFPVNIEEDELRTYFCKSGEYNDMASLAFNPLEAAIKILFHSTANLSLATCAVFFILLATTACWTYGLMIPSGLFVPALVTGAAYGRFWGEIMHQYIDDGSYRGSYALIGSAAFLGGVVRMTISLTVILVEATNEISYGFPIMLTLLVAKWVGDSFNHGIYDAHIFLKKIPLLEYEAEEEMKRYCCRDVMSSPVKCFPSVARVGDIVRLLTETSHNAYVVVEKLEKPFGQMNENDLAEKRFIGVILRSHIITMLQLRCWGTRAGFTTNQMNLSHKDFVKKYPQRTPIEDVSLPDHVNDLFMDLSPYMNPTPFTITPEMPLPRVFLLYRSIGLRHIPVLDQVHRVVGMVTRKELTGYKVHELDHAFEHHHSEA
eukprot:m.483439 g.483439  ORF g.483439 m.483439 type:complete len:852 (-) comp22938_c0_seq1:252-2807(-)